MFDPDRDLPKDIEVKASFRYVDDLKNPVHGICGRWECREKMRLEAVAETNSEPQGAPVKTEKQRKAVRREIWATKKESGSVISVSVCSRMKKKQP
jgi:hypothetical protein